MPDVVKSNLGPVTAYADAVKHGYTGSREDFGNLLAGAGKNLTDAVTAKDAAQEAATDAASSKQSAADSLQGALTAKSAAEKAVEDASAAKNAAETAKAGAEAAQTAAGEQATAAAASATAAENSNTAAKNSADAAAASSKSASDTAGSIKGSLDQIAENKAGVSQLKEATASLRDGKISKFYASSQGNTNLPDSDDGKIMDLKLYGKSSQQQYTGKNLIGTDTKKLGDIITIATASDGSLVLNGTVNNEYPMLVFNLGKIPANTNLKFFCNVVSGNFGGASYRILIFDNGSEIWCIDQVHYTASCAGTFTSPENTDKTQAVLIFYDAGTMKDVKLQVMLTADTSATYDDYEPYVGGIPSPNPEYPQEIKSVVKPRVKVCGKNLLDLRTGRSGTGEGVTYTRNDDGSYTRKGTSTGQSGNVWFLGEYGQETDTATLFVLKQGTYTVKDCVLFSGTGQRNDTFTVTNDWFVTGIRSPYMDVGVTFNDTVYPRLMAGSTDTGWEPYTEQTATLPYTLNAIPVTSGGNVTIAGQQYIADYVDIERGKLVRMCKEVDFEKVDPEEEQNLLSNSREIRYRAENIGIKNLSAETPNNEAGFITSIRRLAPGFGTLDIDQTGIWQCGQGGDGAMLVIRVPLTSAMSNIQYFKSLGGCKGLFQAATPTETDLTADEIAAFKALVSYYPVTNISTTSDQLDGYTVFNYPISLAKGYDYLKTQLGDTRDYLYGIDLMTAEAYVNSEYAAALAEIEV